MSLLLISRYSLDMRIPSLSTARVGAERLLFIHSRIILQRVQWLRLLTGTPGNSFAFFHEPVLSFSFFCIRRLSFPIVFFFFLSWKILLVYITRTDGRGKKVESFSGKKLPHLLPRHLCLSARQVYDAYSYSRAYATPIIIFTINLLPLLFFAVTRAPTFSHNLSLELHLVDLGNSLNQDATCNRTCCIVQTIFFYFSNTMQK